MEAATPSRVFGSSLGWELRRCVSPIAGSPLLVALAKAPLSSAITLSFSSMIGLSIDILEGKAGTLIRYAPGAHPGCHQPRAWRNGRDGLCKG